MYMYVAYNVHAVNQVLCASLYQCVCAAVPSPPDVHLGASHHPRHGASALGEGGGHGSVRRAAGNGLRWSVKLSAHMCMYRDLHTSGGRMYCTCSSID